MVAQAEPDVALLRMKHRSVLQVALLITARGGVPKAGLFLSMQHASMHTENRGI